MQLVLSLLLWIGAGCLGVFLGGLVLSLAIVRRELKDHWVKFR